MRAVVVGASSGLGRCIGIELAKRGTKVALLARRRERLEDAAADAGNGAVAIECDATDEAACRAGIDEAVGVLGGIDALIYAPAITPLARLVDTDAELWRRVFEVNVIGASLMTAAALPHLQESHGKAIYLSTVSASLTPPWPGLGAYITSKAALDKMIDAWRNEVGGVNFTRLVVGECAGGEGDAMTGMSTDWDHELAAELMPVWTGRRYMTGELLPIEELVEVVDTIVRGGTSMSVPTVYVTPRYGLTVD